MIEHFLKEIVGLVDFEVYKPLYRFIEADKHLGKLLRVTSTIAGVTKKYLAKKKLNHRLYRFYSKDLMRFIYTMVNSISWS